MDHEFSYPKGGIVLVCYDDYAKEWGAMGPWGPTYSTTFYKPQIKSRTVHRERPVTGESIEAR